LEKTQDILKLGANGFSLALFSGLKPPFPKSLARSLYPQSEESLKAKSYF